MPIGLDVDNLQSEVERRWEFTLDAFTFDPVGAGSYHWRASTKAGRTLFVTVDDLDTKQAWGADRAERFAALKAVFDGVRALDAWPWVVAPIPAADGSAVCALGERFTVVVHPLLEGRAGTFDTVTTPAQRAEVLAALAQLHTVAPPGGLRRVPLFPERQLLTDALQALDRPWDSGPYGSRARGWLASNRAEIERLVAELEIAETSTSGELVLTHGEPHPGNLLWTSDGLRVVDWDTLALAPKERDLWHVRVQHADEFTHYEQTTGTRVDRALLQRYADAWQLSDMALYVDALRRPHVDDADARFAWEILSSPR